MSLDREDEAKWTHSKEDSPYPLIQEECEHFDLIVVGVITKEGWGLLLVKLLCENCGTEWDVSLGKGIRTVDLPNLPSLPDLLNDNDLEKGTNNDTA